MDKQTEVLRLIEQSRVYHHAIHGDDYDSDDYYELDEDDFPQDLLLELHTLVRQGVVGDEHPYEKGVVHYSKVIRLAT
jgi:hypothetical protein